MRLRVVNFVGLFLIVFLLISSQVAEARSLTEVSIAQEVGGRELLQFSETIHTSKKTDEYYAPGYDTDPCPFGC